MTVLVGIPTHRRPDTLRACLESIASQEDLAGTVEVFVVDNDADRQEGSKVAAQLAEAYRFSLTSTVVPTPGISAVRNAILDEARKRDVNFIAMIDDDETASPRWLASLLEMQKITNADIVGGPVEPIFRSPPSEALVHSGVFWSEKRESGKTIPLTGAGNFLASAATLSKTGWPQFDLQFGLSGGEDGEWFNRLARLGYCFAWSATALAKEDVTTERTTTFWALRRSYRCGNSITLAALKHRDWGYVLFTTARALLVLVSAPLMAPMLIMAKWRMWLLVRWYRAAGRLTALFGYQYQEYGGRHAGPA